MDKNADKLKKQQSTTASANATSNSFPHSTHM
jgi:hypothetical protein